MTLLEAQGIFAGYGGIDIVRDVSITVGPAEVVTIIGPNGAGKSTLVKAIFGVLPPSRGKVFFKGEDITGSDPERLVRKGLTYVPQTENVFPSLTVRENLQMGAYVRRGDYSARLEEVLDIFANLRRALSVRAKNLSGGERQMLALAKTLMLDPELILIDEPSAGLAPVLVDAVFERIREIQQHGTSIVLVEQNARKALALANRAYVLEMGQKRFEDTGAALLANPDVGKLYLGG